MLLHLRGLPRDDLLARLHAAGAEPRADDPDVQIAEDAAVRAARALDLLGGGPGRAGRAPALQAYDGDPARCLSRLARWPDRVSRTLSVFE